MVGAAGGGGQVATPSAGRGPHGHQAGGPAPGVTQTDDTGSHHAETQESAWPGTQCTPRQGAQRWGQGWGPRTHAMTLPPASTGTSPPDMGGSVLMGGPVLAGLEDSSSVPPGLHRVKDAPQTGEAHGQPPILRNCPGHRAMARLHGARGLESLRAETPAHPSPGGDELILRGGRGPAERRLSCRLTSQSPGPTEAHTPVRQTPAQSWVGVEMQAPLPANPRGCLETGSSRRPSASW